jgi:microcystin-dependent protein
MPFIGNTPDVNFTSFAKQDLTGVTGSPVKRGFTLTHAVANANEIEVFVNNVRQEPTEAYTVSGTGLTMTGDVETSDDFYIIYLGKALQTVVPPDGSVSTAKIADSAITQAKLHSDLIFVPSGMIMPFGGSSSPTGFLACDGSAISRTTYSTLFTAIATTWGVGDGSSTFNVPDLRAMFLRGTGSHGTANMAKGTDFSAPAVGTIEDDQMQDHRHNTPMSPGTALQGYSSYQIGNHAYSTTYDFVSTSPIEANSQGTPRTGDETRPVNASVLYVIKT